mmetsp:Transcript_15707/g.36494  ORF Transcript_15707/g.36494 Transcript_15707/m.36494 type:complete len:209 (+) Transcript_15707:1176-1802(+)
MAAVPGMARPHVEDLFGHQISKPRCRGEGFVRVRVVSRSTRRVPDEEARRGLHRARSPLPARQVPLPHSCSRLSEGVCAQCEARVQGHAGLFRDHVDGAFDGGCPLSVHRPADPFLVAQHHQREALLPPQALQRWHHVRAKHRVLVHRGCRIETPMGCEGRVEVESCDFGAGLGFGVCADDERRLRVRPQLGLGALEKPIPGSRRLTF